MVVPVSSPSAAQPSPGLRIATVHGVPVYIGRSWALLAGVIIMLVGPQLQPELGGRAYLIAALYAVLLLVAVLVHEAAHAVGARSFGLPVHRVVADLWGGHTTLDATRSTPARSAVVAAVGPLSNLALSGVGYGLAAVLPPGIPHGLAEIFGLLNLLLALFNLLPGLPLDGGQLVEAAVWGVTGDRHRARVVAGYCGIVITLGVLYYFVGRPLLSGQTPSITSLAWALLICFFLWQGARGAIASGRVSGVVSRYRVLDVLQPAVPVSHRASLAEIPTGQPPVVVDDAGRPVALVDPQALASVPPGAYAATPVASVARPQPADWAVEIDPNAPVADLLPTLSASPTGVLAVVHAGRLLGLVTVPRVNEVLSQRTPSG